MVEKMNIQDSIKMTIEKISPNIVYTRPPGPSTVLRGCCATAEAQTDISHAW
jgi:hypothetical protein